MNLCEWCRDTGLLGLAVAVFFKSAMVGINVYTLNERELNQSRDWGQSDPTAW